MLARTLIHRSRTVLDRLRPLVLLTMPAAAGAPTPQDPTTSVSLVSVVVGTLILIGATVVSLIVILQKKFMWACEESDQLELFAKTPFGVGPGAASSGKQTLNTMMATAVSSGPPVG